MPTQPKPKKVAVAISIDPVNMPGSFNLSEVESTLRSQLEATVFNDLVAGQSVEVTLAIDPALSATLGWKGNPKTRFSARVIWRTLPLTVCAMNDYHKGTTTIDPENVDLNMQALGMRPDTQTWVNLIAHETIWGNCGGFEDDNAQGPGDIASETRKVDPFTVTARSRKRLLDQFQLRSK
jgi:hypothetical protein